MNIMETYSQGINNMMKATKCVSTKNIFEELSNDDIDVTPSEVDENKNKNDAPNNAPENNKKTEDNNDNNNGEQHDDTDKHNDAINESKNNVDVRRQDAKQYTTYKAKIAEAINRDNVADNEIIFNAMKSDSYARKHEKELNDMGITVDFNHPFPVLIGSNGKELRKDSLKKAYYGPSTVTSSHYTDTSDRYKRDVDYYKSLTNPNIDERARKKADRYLKFYTSKYEQARRNEKEIAQKYHEYGVFPNPKRSHDLNDTKVDFKTYLTKKNQIDKKRNKDMSVASPNVNKYNELKQTMDNSGHDLSVSKQYYSPKTGKELEAEENKIRQDAQSRIDALHKKNELNRLLINDLETQYEQDKKSKNDFMTQKRQEYAQRRMKNESLLEARKETEFRADKFVQELINVYKTDDVESAKELFYADLTSVTNTLVNAVPPIKAIRNLSQLELDPMNYFDDYHEDMGYDVNERDEFIKDVQRTNDRFEAYWYVLAYGDYVITNGLHDKPQLFNLDSGDYYKDISVDDIILVVNKL